VTATQFAAVFVVLARRKAQGVARLIAGVLCADLLPFCVADDDQFKKTCRPDRFQMADNFLGNVHFLLLGSCGLVGLHIVLDELTKAQVSFVLESSCPCRREYHGWWGSEESFLHGGGSSSGHFGRFAIAAASFFVNRGAMAFPHTRCGHEISQARCVWVHEHYDFVLRTVFMLMLL
jgi:hypothetical protein